MRWQRCRRKCQLLCKLVERHPIAAGTGRILCSLGRIDEPESVIESMGLAGAPASSISTAASVTGTLTVTNPPNASSRALPGLTVNAAVYGFKPPQ